MTEQWQELKETITEMRDNDGTGSQQDVCKFLVDYMEVLEKQMQQPTEKCKGCYYNDGDTHAECVVCDKETQPTDEVKCDCATEEIANSFIEDVEAVKDQLEAQPCEDCISRQKALDCFEQTNTRQGAKYAIETLPFVTPERPNPDMIKRIKRKIDEMTEIHSDGEFYIKSIDAKWIISKYLYGAEERPKGRWIATENEEMNIDGYFCSCCDLPMETEERTKYCPNCGSYNGGEQCNFTVEKSED